MDRFTVISKIATLPGEDVLIVGVGPGCELYPLLKAKKNITGIDVLPHYVDTYEHVLGDYEAVPFGKDQFDHIVCCHTLEHMLNPGHVLDKMKQELQIDGWLALCLPGMPQEEYWPGHLTLWTPMHITGYLLAAGWDCTDAHWFTNKSRSTIGYLLKNKERAVHSPRYGLGDYFPANLKGKIEERMNAWVEDRWDF